MPTLEIRVNAPPDLQEILLAELAELGFSAFSSERSALRGYRPHEESRFELSRNPIQAMLESYGIRDAPVYTIHLDRNWNAEWESTIRRIRVGKFVIAPEWDLPANVDDAALLRISPKMSFGTGHHESTRLALRLLENVVHHGDSVLDAGTGTGILAIAAIKLGAATVVAFDTDASVEENFHENVRANAAAEYVTFFPAPIERVPRERVDVVVANINRNVLMGYMPDFVERLMPGGRLVLSGVLATDRAVVVGAAHSRGMRLVEEIQEGAWWSGAFSKEDSQDA